jgi:hypothetical protein
MVTPVQKQRPETQVQAQRASAGPSRLIFGLDATASRQPTWDQACALQAEIFTSATAAAKVQVQLLYFRGLDECRASQWFTNSTDLNNSMVKIVCQGGHTQIRKALKHARKEADSGGLRGMLFVGDAFEEQAYVDSMLGDAQALGLKGVPVFMLQEGDEREAERVFKMIAHASGGVHLRFDGNAPAQMAKLLQAVGAYLATGNMEEIKALAGPGDVGRLGSR